MAAQRAGWTLTVTLADGTSHSITVQRMPRHWKSAVMRRCPMGTDYRGAAWSRQAG